jgi:hypothetical protein
MTNLRQRHYKTHENDSHVIWKDAPLVVVLTGSGTDPANLPIHAIANGSRKLLSRAHSAFLTLEISPSLKISWRGASKTCSALSF